MKQQEPPFCVQIEFTEGCNLRCPFCGLNGIRGKENMFKFMTLETAERIASQMAIHKWNARVEFAMHGEPTMNPFATELVATFRRHLPKSYFLMETNGSGLMKDPIGKIRDFFQAGLTTLAIDEYQGIKWAQHVREGLGEEAMNPSITSKINFFTIDDAEEALDSIPVHYYEYPAAGPDGNPHKRSVHKRLIFIAPINASTTGTHSTISNHAGAGGPLNDVARGKPCAKPFRELGFRHDGSVAVCCNDWRGEFPIGAIHKLSLNEIWQHPRMNAARSFLYHGMRVLKPCLGCDHISYRTGLLPDKSGLETLPEPTDAEAEIWESALLEGPLTTPVKRPWEVKS